MYKSFWTPVLGKALVGEAELGNINDPCVAGVRPRIGGSSLNGMSAIPI